MVAVAGVAFLAVANLQAASIERSAANRLEANISTDRVAGFEQLKPDFETPGETRFAIGDRLKIMFFERIRATVAADAPFSQSFIERTELTSEYLIQQDGSASIGLLGDIKLGGETAPAAQQQLELAYKTAFGKDARAVLSIVEREPVYIIGPVAKPGAYEFSPGMTVLHAVARAGGQTFGTPGSGDYFEAVRETERYEQSLLKQQKLLASIAVLKADRDSTAPVVPQRLIALAGSAAANGLLAEADSIRRLNRESKNSRLAALDATIAAASRELVSQSSRIANIKANVESKSERLQLMKGLAERQSASAFSYMQAKSELSDIKERLDEAIGQESQVEDRRSQAGLEKSRLVIDAKLELERDLAAAEDQLVQEERSAAASEKVLGASASLRSQAEAAAGRMTCTILRRQTDGLNEMPATVTTRLQPGDLVRVEMIRPEGLTSPAADLPNGQADTQRPPAAPGHAKNGMPVVQ